jgi:transcriptional regulator of acetoin/glycerol metabolism
MLDRDREWLEANEAERIPARPEIVQSWRRCQMSGVSPDKLNLTHLPVDSETRFSRCVTPVLAASADRLRGTDSAILLTNPAGRLIWRWSDRSELAHKLDRHDVVPGTMWDEPSVGTGGIGTALETATLITVTGFEHYVEDLHPFTCVAAPVRHPITRRIEGVLNVTCQTKYASPLMRPVLARMVADAEAELFGDSSLWERELYHHFLAERRRSQAAVFALNDSVLIANSIGARLNLDHRTLWVQAERALESGGEMAIESEEGGRRTEMRQLRSGGLSIGFLMVVTDPPGTSGDGASRAEPAPAAQPARRGADRHVPGVATLPGPRWSGLVDAARLAMATGDPLLVVGEPGTGKLTLVQEIVPPGSRLQVVDVAAAGIADRASWLASVAETMSLDGTTTVLVHLQALDDATCAALAAAIDSVCANRPIALAATWTGTPDKLSAAQRSLLDRFGVDTVVLAPLRWRQEDLAGMLDAALMSRPGDPRQMRVTPAAKELIHRYRWPGNAREFEAFARWVRTQSRPVIDVPHLPAKMQREVLRRRLSQLEAAEADLIATAMQQHGGNKVAVARALGMSRSSLYRKLRLYRLGS